MNLNPADHGQMLTRGQVKSAAEGIPDDRCMAAARALWRIGNDRIGHRRWEEVCDHYIAEAQAALDAADEVLPIRDLDTLAQEIDLHLNACGLSIGYTKDIAFEDQIPDQTEIVRDALRAASDIQESDA